jgi:hypothetical protein
MGRKQSRKRERRAAQRAKREGWGAALLDFEPDMAPFQQDFGDMFSPFGREDVIVATRTCGGCREFLEDGEAGRGTCLHPASGILSPWSDTEACGYWTRR